MIMSLKVWVHDFLGRSRIFVLVNSVSICNCTNYDMPLSVVAFNYLFSPLGWSNIYI